MEIVFTSIIAFASTNIDDLFILTLFLGDSRYQRSDVYLGQYLGMIVLIAVSVTGSLAGNFVDPRYVGLLGLFPIYLGLKQFIGLMKRRSEGETQQEKTNYNTGLLGIATVTIANGGDNIGTYVPLFATLTTWDKLIMVMLFLLMVSAWLAMAKYLTTHPILASAISRYGHIITPIVLFLLGIFILETNGSLNLIK